jgi:formylglycine-generating enzyme required for sulfatase activity
VLFAPAVSIHSFLLAAAGAAIWLTVADAQPLDRILTESEEMRLTPGNEFQECSLCPRMIVVPAGKFVMGAPLEEGRYVTEQPMHEVTIVRPFAVGKFELTFAEWDACTADGGCKRNPSDKGWGRGRQPVMLVSWNDAQEYVVWLARKTTKKYRLLTEAEWEYVARAGTKTAYYFGDRITKMQANFDYARDRPAEVGSYPANQFGLHDVHGNVSEWVEDCAVNNYRDAPTDGSAVTNSTCRGRRLRGGSYTYLADGVRSASRAVGLAHESSTSTGMRVARTLDAGVR